MLGIDALLELPIVVELELLCRFIQAFFKDLDAFSFPMISWIPTGFPEPWEEKHHLSMMYA